MTEAHEIRHTRSDLEKAAWRIEEARKTGQIHLNLGDLEIEEIPPELKQLTWLQYLSLGLHDIESDGKYKSESRWRSGIRTSSTARV